jgi:hypothetical protein
MQKYHKFTVYISIHSETRIIKGDPPFYLSLELAPPNPKSYTSQTKRRKTRIEGTEMPIFAVAVTGVQ